MKLFNPFRQHLATVDNKFVIRRWFLVWWYRDTNANDDYWWHDSTYVKKWSLFPTEASARARMRAPKLKSKFYAN